MDRDSTWKMLLEDIAAIEVMMDQLAPNYWRELREATLAVGHSTGQHGPRSLICN
jgi:hypothetical protein